MHYAHKSIPEALEAFQDLGAKVFIPIQWGTFQLGDEPPGYPVLDLMRTTEERKLDPSRFILLDLGEIRPIRPMPKVAHSGCGSVFLDRSEQYPWGPKLQHGNQGMDICNRPDGE